MNAEKQENGLVLHCPDEREIGQGSTDYCELHAQLTGEKRLQLTRGESLGQPGGGSRASNWAGRCFRRRNSSQ